MMRRVSGSDVEHGSVGVSIEDEKPTRLDVEEFQRFCDMVGDEEARRGLTEEKLADLLQPAERHESPPTAGNRRQA